MITLDEVIKLLAFFEDFEVFDIDNNITYSKEEADDLIWHEYEVKHIYSLTDELHPKSPTTYTVLEVSKIC